MRTDRPAVIDPGTSPVRHPALAIAAHWLSAAAVVIAFTVAWSRAALDEPGRRETLMLVHQAAGLLVFVLLLVRVVTRLTTRAAAPRHELPAAMRVAAWGSHSLLYGLLLAMPLLGWSLVNARGHAVHVAGLFALPELVTADPDLADSLEAWHVGLSWVLLAAVVAHAAAAVFHHFVRRDDVVRSMLPAVRPRTARQRPATANRYSEETKTWT